MTTDTDTFTFERKFPLSPDRMWTLLTSPEYRETWGAPEEGAVLETLSSDFRIGGEDHQRCGPADAPDFEAITRWYNINEPNNVVYTEQIQAGGMTLGASLATIVLSKSNAGSHVSITVAVSSFVGPEMMAEFQGGWEGAMKKLDALVDQQNV
ncbi:MAG: SRPBCC domain-containing protein [Planktomarina sp.]